jgi:hypothetical protein
MVSDDQHRGEREHEDADGQPVGAPYDRVVAEQVQPGRQAAERPLRDQESSEKMSWSAPRMPKPTATRDSATRMLATLGRR